MTRNPIQPHLIHFKPQRVEDKRDKQAAREARQHMIETDMDMSYCNFENNEYCD
jgi:hypothetical protein